MYFESLSALIHMDGHGVYVWSVYAVALVIVIQQVVAPVLRMKGFWRREQALYKRLQGKPAGTSVQGD